MALNYQYTNIWQTNWTKCCLCQTDKNECVIFPTSNLSKKAEDGYTLLGKNIPQVHAVNQFPIKLDPRRLDDGSGIESTLRKNQAKCHRSCRLMFNNTKLQKKLT